MVQQWRVGKNSRKNDAIILLASFYYFTFRTGAI